MSRIVEDKMRHPILARSLAVVLLLSVGTKTANAQDGPELTPPTNMPAQPKPAPTVRSQVTNPGSRAVLALPGITTPSSRSSGIITSTPAITIEPRPVSGELTLDSPLEMQGVVPPTRPRSESLSGPIPPDPLPMGDSPLPGNASSRRSTGSSSRVDPSPTPPPPLRRSRFFGMVPGPTVAPPAPKPSSAGRSVAERSKDDPVVETALKTRIEKQARQAVGDRVRSVEVHVEGKNVSILARGVRFYQKRAVRKSLEVLPAISGLRTTIDVVD